MLFVCYTNSFGWHVYISLVEYVTTNEANFFSILFTFQFAVVELSLTTRPEYLAPALIRVEPRTIIFHVSNVSIHIL
jgi:hypothetical protein